MIKTSVTSAAMYRNRIYLQTLYIDKNQSWLCYKCDREHDFDVVLGQVVPCRKLKWICRMHSIDLAQQVETKGNSTIFVA